MHIDVRTIQARETGADEKALRAERVRAQADAARLTRTEPEDELDIDQLAVNMIRLFVDELRYNVDSHGSMRMRMVKYLVD